MNELLELLQSAVVVANIIITLWICYRLKPFVKQNTKEGEKG